MALISIYMVAKKNTGKKQYREEVITADYILNLYKECKAIKNPKTRQSFMQDVKKLIPYIGKTVVLQLED